MNNKLFDGVAKITAIEFQELRFTEGLTEEQIEPSMNIALTAKPSDDAFGERPIGLGASPRECKGRDAGRTWLDDTMDKLTKHGLIENGDITTVANCVGKEIPVYQKESKPDKNGKVWVRTYIGSAVKKIDKAAALSRLAKLTGGATGGAAAGAPKDDPFAK